MNAASILVGGIISPEAASCGGRAADQRKLAGASINVDLTDFVLG